MNILKRLFIKIKKKVHKDFKKITWRDPLVILLCVLLVFLFVGSSISGIFGFNHKIVIELDAAFGGDSNGYEGIVTSASENEKIVDTLAEILNQDQRFKAVKTHEEGSSSIEERKTKIQKDNPSIVISIRLQGSPYADKSGMYTYAQLPSMKCHKESKKLADAIIDAFADDQNIPNEGYLYYSPIEDTETYELLYKNIEDEEVEDLNTFDLMEECENTPIVVVSPFYVTNATEVETYANEEGYQMIAKKLYQAICDFNGIEEKNI